MPHPRPSRRSLLTSLGMTSLGMGGAAYFLPTLRQGAQALPAGPPKRLVIFYSQHGTLPWLWSPSGTRTDFKMNYLLEPLEPYKKDLILIDGVDLKGLELPDGRGGNDGHATCQAGSMTANRQINHLTGDIKSRGKGPSFDWFLPRRLEAQNGGKSPTPFPEQRFRIYDRLGTNPNWYRPFEDDKNQWLLPVNDPNQTYPALFGGALPGKVEPMDDAKILRRKSTLDFAVKEFSAVANKVGRFEKQRLDQHADLIRSLENQLAARAESASQCEAPAKPTKSLSGANWDLTWTGHTEITRAAFLCDLTRVIVLHVDEPSPMLYGGINPSALGGIDTLHNLVHAISTTAKEDQDRAKLATAKGYYRGHATLFKKFLDMLSEVKESDGQRLLDHTAVLWCGELGDPSKHTPHNQKWIVAGSCGGALKTGQHLRYAGDMFHSRGMRDEVPSNGDVFTTLAHAMGVRETFGPAPATRGPIADMLT